MAKIFICYRRADSASQAARIAGDLSSEFGHKNVFFDQASLEPGINITETIRERIIAADVVLMLIGPSWIESDQTNDDQGRIFEPLDYVRQEILAALISPTTWTIPVLLNDAKMPTTDQLPVELRGICEFNAAILSESAWEPGINILIRGIRNRIKPNRLWWLSVASVLALSLAALTLYTVTALRSKQYSAFVSAAGGIESPWIDTGIELGANDMVHITASGKANLSIQHAVEAAEESTPSPHIWFGPSGIGMSHSDVARRDKMAVGPSFFLQPDSPAGVLLATVSADVPRRRVDIDDVICIGNEYTFTTTEGGRLYLTINDIWWDAELVAKLEEKGDDFVALAGGIRENENWSTWYDDNIGGFLVHLKITRGW